MSGTKEQGKHTPGPWRVGEGGMPSRLNVWAGAAYQIAQVKRFPAADDVRQIQADAEAEANARLIAAAPRMYDRIVQLAASGDAEANSILEQINGTHGKS